MGDTMAPIDEDRKQAILSPLDQKRLVFAGVTNISRCNSVVKALIGPRARVWDRGGVVSIGEELGDGSKSLLGAGLSFVEALLDMSREMSADAVMDKAGPEIRATLTADRRKPQPLLKFH